MKLLYVMGTEPVDEIELVNRRVPGTRLRGLGTTLLAWNSLPSNSSTKQHPTAY